MMRLGLIGLPNAGKSTLFNAVSGGAAETGNYPFTTIDRNVSAVPVPDQRLEVVARLAGSARSVPVVVEWVDIAGLVKGAHRGEGLGNRFLGHIREADALVHVVRCHQDPDVAHVEGRVDPVRDEQVVGTELLLADLETVDRLLAEIRPLTKGGDPEARARLGAMEALRAHLNEGLPARLFTGEGIPEGIHLLTAKPQLYAANIDDEVYLDLAAAGSPLAAEGGCPAPARWPEPAAELLAAVAGTVVLVAARWEGELASLDGETAAAMAAEWNLRDSGRTRLLTSGYRLLDLITFFTANRTEARARSIRRGTTAWEAAGKVHSDMQRGFIRAEVAAYADLAVAASLAALREKGRLRLEGRDYVVQDGDLIHFRFNVQ